MAGYLACALPVQETAIRHRRPEQGNQVGAKTLRRATARWRPQMPRSSNEVIDVRRTAGVGVPQTEAVFLTFGGWSDAYEWLVHDFTVLLRGASYRLGMFMPKLCVVLPPADRAQFATLAAKGTTPQKLAIRARIMLMLADHIRPAHVAARVAVSRNHVHYWVRRYLMFGVIGVVRDAARPGRKKRITPEQVAAIVNATLTTTPPGRTHWSTRRMARAQGLSEKTIRNIWHQHGLQPQRGTRFKLSKDPRFVDKLRDVVGALSAASRESRRLWCR
jgi:transposase